MDVNLALPLILVFSVGSLVVAGFLASWVLKRDTGTTAMQAISIAGGWIYGGNLWNTVVFRRGDDWRLLATKLDLRGPLYGKRPCPADEIWLNDSDIVLVPKHGILVADNIISLLFTQGLYGIAPFSTATTFSITRFGAL